MRISTCVLLAVGGLLAAETAAEAACTGGWGRGWASGKGMGSFSMTAADKTCDIGTATFINDATKARTPAETVVLTRAPANGKVTVTKAGAIAYTPKKGFRGDDSFCTKSTTRLVNGSLSGCFTVTVK